MWYAVDTKANQEQEGKLCVHWEIFCGFYLAV